MINIRFTNPNFGLGKFGPVILSFFVFLLYLFTMPKTVALEDDGFFIMSAYFNGISHPPGYPLYAVLGHLYTLLPFGSPAINVHALSSTFGALSCWMMWIITNRLTRNQSIAYIAAIAYAISDGVWSQSIIAEVYTFNVFLFLCTLYYVIRIYDATTNSVDSDTNVTKNLKLRKEIFLLAVLVGLGLSNHWPLYVLAGTGLAIIMWRHIGYFFKHWYVIAPGLMIGLLPFLWMYINLNGDTFIKFHGTIDSLSGLWHFIARKEFNAALDFSSTATYVDKAKYLVFSVKLLLDQWGPLGGIFTIMGILLLHRYIKAPIRYGLFASYLSNSLLLALVLGYDFNDDMKILFPPYLLLAHAIGAMFFAIGVKWFVDMVDLRVSRRLANVVMVLLLTQALVTNYFRNDRSDYVWAANYARHVLDTVKQNSILFVQGDVAAATIGYLHYVEGYRPDVTVINEIGLIFGTRLFEPMKTKKEKRERLLIEYTKSSKVPVYYTDTAKFLKLGFKNRWLVWEYDKSINAKSEKINLSNKNIAYLHDIFSDKPFIDRWTLMQRNFLRRLALVQLLSQLNYGVDIEQRKWIKKYIIMEANDLKGVMIMLTLTDQFPDNHNIFTAKQLIELGWTLYAKEERKNVKAIFLTTLGDYYLKQVNGPKAVTLFRQSVAIWGSKNNIAFKKLDILCNSDSRNRPENCH